MRNAIDLAKYTDLRFCLLVGGDSMQKQFERLSDNPDVIVSTPGRLLHIMKEVETLTLQLCNYVVFDEAGMELPLFFQHAATQVAHLRATCRPPTFWLWE